VRNESKVIFIITIVIASVVAYLYYKSKDDETKYKWHKTLDYSKKEPYDLGLFLDMLKLNSGRVKWLKSELKTTLDEETSNKATYLFVGESFYLTREEVESLLKFIKAGNQAMIITESLPDTLLQALSYYGMPIKLGRMMDDEVVLKTNNMNSRFPNSYIRNKGYKANESIVDWHYFETEQEEFEFGDYITAYAPMSSISDKINQAYFSYGEGSIRINTSPVLFTNYFLRDKNLFVYANEMMNDLNMDKLIIDNFSHLPKDDSEKMQRNSPSPLSYILSKKELKTAWYLLLLTAILFLLFKAKRTQRIIPVLERKRNTTVAFAETMSSLFYQQANHKEMAVLKMQLFQFFIKSKLSIPTHEVNARIIRQISVKAGISETVIEDIFEYYKNRVTTSDELSAESLMDFYNKINQFYKLYNKNKSYN